LLGETRAEELAIHRFLAEPFVTCGEMLETVAGHTGAARNRAVGKPLEAACLEAPRPQRDALGRSVESAGNDFDAEAIEPQQDDVGTATIAHTPNGGRARTPPKLLDDAGVGLQVLEALTGARTDRAGP
jgi:hypothetical protein